MISLGAAKLLGIVFESLGYGAFLAVFGYNMYLQIHNLSGGDPKRPNILMLVSSTVLFVMITSRWAVGIARVYEAVVSLEGQIPVSLYFADLTRKKQIVVTALFEFQVIVADFILVYRLHHVWKPRWWICIIPSLAWVGVLVSSSMLTDSMTNPNLSSGVGVFQRDVKRWITASFAFTISNNVYCTAAIIFRLWRTHRSVARVGSDSYIWRALRVFVESASLLTVFLTATFCAFLAGSNIQYTLLDATSPVIGISFVLILLRLNLKTPGSTVNSSGMGSQRGPQSTYPLRSINVNASQHVDVDLGMEGKIAGKSFCSDPA